MLISIVTPVFNCGKYIKMTMDSIHTQNYKNFEHIVIDGLSTDNSLEIINKYSNITLISEKDNGQTNAINKGFKLAHGDILAWQNADDIYLPGTFQIVSDFFESNPEIDVIYGKYRIIDANSNWVCNANVQPWNKWLFAHGRFVPMQTTAFWRRRVYEKVGDLNENLKFCMDIDFFAKASILFKFKALPIYLGEFRVHSESKTHDKNNKEELRKEIRRVLAYNYKYKKIDHFLLDFFLYRSSITDFLKKKIFKK